MMKEPKLLAHQTELIVYRRQSQIEHKGNYWKYVTPDRPDYYWGNFLLFKEAPKKGDYEAWLKTYQAEFDVEKQQFIALGWDSLEEGECVVFKKNGFEFEKCNVLLLKDLKQATSLNANIEIREMKEQWEWDQYVDLHNEGPPYTIAFLNRQMEYFRALMKEGVAIRYGAFVGEKLVGDCGAFFEGDLLRYNNVATHRDFRRQGICRSLVYEATRRILQMNRFKRLVMLADAGEPAEGIYLSLGFEQKEHVYSLQKYW